MTQLATIDVEYRGPLCLLRLDGEIDISNAQELAEQIEAAVPNTSAILVMDLGGTRYLDSAGVQLLFRLAERLRARRQELRLVVPASSPVRAVLELTGLERVILMHTDLEGEDEPGTS